MITHQKKLFKELANELLLKAETPQKLKGYKAWIKKRYKEDTRHDSDHMVVPYPYNRDKRILNIIHTAGEDYGDHFANYYFLEASSVEEAKKIIGNFIAVDGYSINSAYDCTGEAFYHSAEFHHVEGSNRVIVVQGGGIDV